MTILAIDTSNFPLGIALINEDNVIGERITYLRKNHSVRAMPAIENLMQECDIKPADLCKIVVAKGPGSYTGVRIGLTIAKTLAWTLNIPITSVSSLAVLAAGVGRYYGGYVCPIIDARRGYVYTGLYKFEQNNLVSVKEDSYMLLTDLLEHITETKNEVLFVGNDLNKHEQTIKTTLKGNFQFAFQTENNPRPSELAFLGANKKSDDVHLLTPNYLRLAEAEANWLARNKK